MNQKWWTPRTEPPWTFPPGTPKRTLKSSCELVEELMARFIRSVILFFYINRLTAWCFVRVLLKKIKPVKYIFLFGLTSPLSSFKLIVEFVKTDFTPFYWHWFVGTTFQGLLKESWVFSTGIFSLRGFTEQLNLIGKDPSPFVVSWLCLSLFLHLILALCRSAAKLRNHDIQN